MVSSRDLRDFELAGVPYQQLGRNAHNWTFKDINTILRHFGVYHENVHRDRGRVKIEMLRQLDRVTREYGLTGAGVELILYGRVLGVLQDPDPIPYTHSVPNSNTHRRHRGYHDSRNSNSGYQEKVNPVAQRPQPMHAAAPRRSFGRDSLEGHTPADPLYTTQDGNGNQNMPIADAVTSTNNSNAFKGTQKTSNERECTLCGLVTSSHFPIENVTSSCDHEPDVCSSCLSRTIAVQFQTKVWNHIDCPSCRQRLHHDDVKKFADKATFEKYDKLSLESCLDQTQGARFQRCRMPKCESGQYCFPETDSYMICRDCEGRTCITCDIQGHPGFSCDEIAARRTRTDQRHDGEEAAAEQYLMKKTKLCPKCNIRVQKAGGCDHMSCKSFRPNHSDISLMDLAWSQVLDANTNIAGFVLQTFIMFGAMAITCTLQPADITLTILRVPWMTRHHLRQLATILALRRTFIQALLRDRGRNACRQRMLDPRTWDLDALVLIVPVP